MAEEKNKPNPPQGDGSLFNEPEKKESNFSWKRLLLTILFVLLTAGLVGGSIWYVMSEQAKDDKDAHDKQIQELQNKVNDLKKDQGSSDNSSTKNYTNSVTNVSFSYPKDYTLADKTSISVCSAETCRLKPDFAKAALELTKNEARVSVLILESTDMDKVLSSFGDTSDNKTIVKYGDYSGYVATNYGTGFNSKIVVYTIVGSRYSVAIYAPDQTYTTMLDAIIRSVKFN